MIGRLVQIVRCLTVIPSTTTSELFPFRLTGLRLTLWCFLVTGLFLDGLARAVLGLGRFIALGFFTVTNASSDLFAGTVGRVAIGPVAPRRPTAF